jgi:hypothetical protein
MLSQDSRTIPCCQLHCTPLPLLLLLLPAAPVSSLVLPPVSSRLPWSGCVLSVAADGSVAMTCLASSTCQRTFTGWAHGPPSQLAWSSSR